VTEAQLIEEIRAAFTKADLGPDDAMTPNELAAVMDLNINEVRSRLRELVKNGTLQVVTVKRPNWDGRLHARSAVRML